MASVGRNVRVLPVRVLGKCGGYDSDIIAGMRWAAGIAVAGVPENTHAGAVINMSLGGTDACTPAYATPSDQVTHRARSSSSPPATASGLASAPACQPALPTRSADRHRRCGLRHAGTKVGFSDLGPADHDRGAGRQLRQH